MSRNSLLKSVQDNVRTFKLYKQKGLSVVNILFSVLLLLANFPKWTQQLNQDNRNLGKEYKTIPTTNAKY